MTTMTTINGGAAVKGGYYLSKSHWEIFPIQRDGERLPGPVAEHYVKLPTAAVFLLMPVLGGLMVVFLPFIGLYMTAKAAASPLVGMFRRSAQDLAATVTPGWQPGEAHFTGKRPEEKSTAQASSKQVDLEQLAKEIQAKREE